MHKCYGAGIEPGLWLKMGGGPRKGQRNERSVGHGGNLEGIRGKLSSNNSNCFYGDYLLKT